MQLTMLIISYRAKLESCSSLASIIGLWPYDIACIPRSWILHSSKSTLCFVRFRVITILFHEWTKNIYSCDSLWRVRWFRRMRIELIAELIESFANVWVSTTCFSWFLSVKLQLILMTVLQSMRRRSWARIVSTLLILECTNFCTTKWSSTDISKERLFTTEDTRCDILKDVRALCIAIELIIIWMMLTALMCWW